MFTAQGAFARRTLSHQAGIKTSPARQGWRHARTSMMARPRRNNLHTNGPKDGEESKSVQEADNPSLAALFRSYAVYTMCSIPTLVDNSPRLIRVLNVPGLRWMTETFIRLTFFGHFVGGDTAQTTLPLLRNLRTTNKGALLAYSVEVDETEATSCSKSNEEHKGPPQHKRIVEELIHCIDVAADFEDKLGQSLKGRRTWVAIKLTAMLPDANPLIRLSSKVLETRPSTLIPVAFPGCAHWTDLDVLYNMSKRPNTLTEDDISSLRELHADMVRICTRAQEKGVRVIIDAEYSWYQPAMDAITLSLMRQFNKIPSKQDTSAMQPLVYGTWQAYLRRTPNHLEHSLADAKANNYAVGIKLVRGAYHPHELAAHNAKGKSPSISPDPHPPVWETKPETDNCYNSCAKMLVDAIKRDVSSEPTTPSIGVLFATHNWESADSILDEIVKSGLAKEQGDGGVLTVGDEVTERATIAQLYGMQDDLTNHLADRVRSNAPLIMKYVPYGALAEVIPYLSRRALENRSVLGEGTAVKERRRASTQIWSRLFGFWIGSSSG